ncbi:hypothetical protein D3C79_1061530 [compost metagenome]
MNFLEYGYLNPTEPLSSTSGSIPENLVHVYKLSAPIENLAERTPIRLDIDSLSA